MWTINYIRALVKKNLNNKQNNFNKGTNVDLGERLRTIRGKISSEEFAKEMGVSKNSVLNYESGKRTPDADYLLRLSKQYDINPIWLLSGEGAKKSWRGKEILRNLIIEVETLFAKENMSLPPDKKAELIWFMYEEAISKGDNVSEAKEDLVRGTIMRLFKLAEVR